MPSRKKKKLTSHSPHVESTAKTTSTPVPVRSYKPLTLISSPIQLNSTFNRSPISSSPERYQSPILHSPVAQNKNQEKKKKSRPKLPKVRTFHPKKSDRKNTERAVALVNSAESEVVAASSEDVFDEAPLPKRRRIREIISNRREGETEESTPEENTPDQFPCKSVKVVGGSMVDLRVCQVSYYS